MDREEALKIVGDSLQDAKESFTYNMLHVLHERSIEGSDFKTKIGKCIFRIKVDRLGYTVEQISGHKVHCKECEYLIKCAKEFHLPEFSRYFLEKNTGKTVEGWKRLAEALDVLGL